MKKELCPMYTKTPDLSTLNAPITVSNFPILRVFKNSKRPAELRGIYAAVIGREVNFDAFNAGVRCGGGLVVIDVDPRNGGMGSYGNLCSGYGNLSDECSWIVDTPSGGFHLYFTYDHTAYRVSKGTLGAGIDVLGDGCYALIPPSNIDGKSYIKREHAEGIGQEGISKAPLWLLELVGVPLVGGKVSAKDYPLDGGGTREGRDREVEAREGIRVEAGEGIGATLDEAVVVLSRINPDCHRDDWLRIGMGLKHPSGLGDTPTARNTWILWSKGEFTQAWDPSSPHAGLAKKFNAKDCIRVWNSIKNRSGGSESGAYSPITWASVVKLSLISSRELNSLTTLTTLTTTTKEPIMHTTEETAMKLQSEQEIPNNTEPDQTFPLKENALSKQTFSLDENVVSNVVSNQTFPPKENALSKQTFPLKENIVSNQTFPLKENALSKISLARSVDVSTKSLHPYYSQTAEGKVRTAMLPKFIEKLKTKRLLIDVMAHIPNPLDHIFLYPFPDNIVVAFLGGKEVILTVDENLQILRELTEKDLVNKLAVYMQESCEDRDIVDDTNDIRVRRKLVEHFVSALKPIETPVIPYVAPGYPAQLCIHYSTLVPNDGTTPAWDELLKGVKTQKMRNQLMAFIAILLLYPDTKLLQYVLMTGTGGLGKSSVLIAVKEWLGKAAGTFRIAETRFGISAILNKRLVYLDEISDFKFLESDIFKSCTGSLKAQVSLEEKFGKAFDFNPKYTMWMLATNQIPNIKQDDANMRRIIPIEFARPRNGIPIKRIPNMEQTLIDEMPHFVWKCDQVLKQNPVKDGMIQSVEDACLSINSMTADLITSQLGLTPNPLSKVPCSKIGEACRSLGMTDIQIGAILKQLASEKFCGLKKIKGIRFLTGYSQDEDA